MYTRPLTALVIALLPRVALADCPSVDIWLGRMEQDIVALRLDQAQDALAQAEAGFSCGPPATTAQIARFWRAEGVLLTIRKREEEAEFSFAAARRIEPDVWSPVFGPEMKKLFQAAQGLDDPPSTLTLQPWDARYLGWIDGRATTFPVQVDAGLHLIQASRSPRASDATIEYGKIMLISDGAMTTLNTPFPRDPGLLTETRRPDGPSRSSVALVAGGAASALAGSALLWLGSRQNEDYSAAMDGYESGDLTQSEALGQVTGAHRAQVSLGVGGGALIAVGAGAVVVGVIRW